MACIRQSEETIDKDKEVWALRVSFGGDSGRQPG